MPIPFIERVEDRTLFANSTGLDLRIDAVRTLHITGTADADNIVLKGYDGYVEVTTPSGTQGIARKKFRRIQIDAGAGSDRVTLVGMLTRSVTVFGGGGNDRLVNNADNSVMSDPPPTGLRPASALFASWVTINTGGAIWISTRSQIDRPAFAFYGGGGDDTIALPRLVTDTLPGDIVNGGSGTDRVTLRNLDANGVGSVVNLGLPKFDWAVLRTPLRLNSEHVEQISVPKTVMVTRNGVFQALQTSLDQFVELTLPIVDQPPVMA